MRFYVKFFGKARCDIVTLLFLKFLRRAEHSYNYKQTQLKQEKNDKNRSTYIFLHFSQAIFVILL